MEMDWFFFYSVFLVFNATQSSESPKSHSPSIHTSIQLQPIALTIHTHSYVMTQYQHQRLFGNLARTTTEGVWLLAYTAHCTTKDYNNTQHQDNRVRLK